MAYSEENNLTPKLKIHREDKHEEQLVSKQFQYLRTDFLESQENVKHDEKATVRHTAEGSCL